MEVVYNCICKNFFKFCRFHSFLQNFYNVLYEKTGCYESEFSIFYPSTKLFPFQNFYAYGELLSCVDMRGFMTSHGQPDCSRASRYVLKDYVTVR